MKLLLTPIFYVSYKTEFFVIMDKHGWLKFVGTIKTKKEAEA